MTGLTNRLDNWSNKDIWVVYSVKSKSGGYDEWRVRLLRAGFVARYIVDIDYIKPKDDIYLNGKKGWWKLAQGGSYKVFNNANKKNQLTAIRFGGYIPFIEDFRYFEDWAKNVDGQSDEQIKNTLAEWERLKDEQGAITAE